MNNIPSRLSSSGANGGNERLGTNSIPLQLQLQQQQQQQQYPQRYSQRYSHHQTFQPQNTMQQSQSPVSSPQRSNGSSGSGPRAKCDQVVFEAIAKAAEIVVASRCWIDGDLSSAAQTGSGRFNLLVPEVKSVR